MKTNSKSRSKDTKVPFQVDTVVSKVTPTLEAPKVNQKVWKELYYQRTVIDDLRNEMMEHLRENAIRLSNLKAEITKLSKRIDEVTTKLLEGE